MITTATITTVVVMQLWMHVALFVMISYALAFLSGLVTLIGSFHAPSKEHCYCYWLLTLRPNCMHGRRMYMLPASSCARRLITASRKPTGCLHSHFKVLLKHCSKETKGLNMPDSPTWRAFCARQLEVPYIDTKSLKS